MANYGRLGPAGALRYCRSVSIDFEEEPSTQETEQREQALLQKLGFYDERIEAKMRSDTEFHRIVGAQTKTNGTERKMTRESFLMAARQLWGLDHVQAAAAFASADLTGEDTLNKREYLLLREAFHHRDARPCAELDRMRGAALWHKYDRRGPKGLTREDYRDFVADLCAGDTHVDHVMRVLEQHRESKNRPRLIPDAMCGEQGLSEEDFLSDLLDQDLLGPRGLEKRDLLMGFSGDSPQRRRRHRWRASDARAEADGGQANRPGLRVALEAYDQVAVTRATEAQVASTSESCEGVSRKAVTRPVHPEAVNADLELAAPLACEFDWRGPGAAQRDSELFDVAMGCVDRAGAMARSCLNAPEDELDRTWLCDPPDAALSLLLDATDPSVLARRVVELAQACKRIAAAQPPLVRARLPCKIFGDTHGQLRDVLLLFASFGAPTHKNAGDVELCSYVFNGDFIDRGEHQVALVALLFALKALYPQRIYLVRGNHEFRSTSERMGPTSFRAACSRAFPPADAHEVYEACFGVFEWLPLAALVADRILVVHGGVGDGSWRLEDLAAGVPRPLSDLRVAPAWVVQALWSDPSDSDADMRRGVHMSPRGGISVEFGPDVTDRFCEGNGIDLVVRSHQYVRRGYKYMHAGRLVTLFSARNYFGREENDAALLLVARDGYGQIRVRPKRLPAYVAGAHPSLGAPSTSQRRRRSRSGSPKRRRSRSSSPYTSDDEADVATTAGALDAAFAETPPPPPPKAHFSPSPKVHSSLGL
jgi:diadenosine tetraphosphatase ApaH/serine/threonine PP2A family protein phosphatase